jgi:SecD/SecF fusion protein
VLGVADATTTTTTSAPPPTTTDQPAEELVLEDEDGNRLRLGPARVTGEAVGGARAAFDTAGGGEWSVEVDFRGDGERQWAALTGEAACAPAGDPARRVAIVLDRDVISSPRSTPR